jgi:hypothetical protein
MSARATYQAVMDQRAEIMRASVGIDYAHYTTGPLSFDYERPLSDTGAAACAMARQMPEEHIIVVQETEYTGAGKPPLSQLYLAQQLGIEVRRGDPRENKPGQVIVIPQHPSQIEAVEVDVDRLRRLYLHNALHALPEGQTLTDADVAFLAADTKSTSTYVREVLHECSAPTR